MKKRIGNKGKEFWMKILSSFQICVYIFGIILVVWICWKIGISINEKTWPPKVDVLANWAQIIVAYAAMFAVGQYAVAYSAIGDKKTENVLSLVRFFREELLGSGDSIMRNLRKGKSGLPIILLRKNTPYLKFTEEEYFTKIYPNQKDVLQAYAKIAVEDPDLDELIRASLNSAEEFSIGILNSNSQKHIAVSSIKKPFVQFVEELGVPLYYYIGLLDDGFPYTAELYRLWKKDIGFLPRTLDDKAEVLRERGLKYQKHK